MGNIVSERVIHILSDGDETSTEEIILNEHLGTDISENIDRNSTKENIRDDENKVIKTAPIEMNTTELQADKVEQDANM